MPQRSRVRRSTPRLAMRLLLPSLSFVLVLAACALIPPQTVQDPLGLDGVAVPLAPIGAASASLQPQQARPCSAFAGEMTHCASQVFAEEVPNIDDSGFGGIVARFDTIVGTDETIEVAALPGVEAPTSLTLTAVAMDLSVEDVTTGDSVHPDPFRPAVATSVTFERVSCTAVACRYQASYTTPLDVEIAFHGAELDALLGVLTGGGDNRLSGTIAYAAEAEGVPAEVFGFQVTLDAPTGTIQF